MNVIGQGLNDANGFELWRRLVKLSEPAYRTKAWVWRRHLANPTFPSDKEHWASALHQWESELREFEQRFKTDFAEDEKVSIIAHMAPKVAAKRLYPLRCAEHLCQDQGLHRAVLDQQEPLETASRITVWTDKGSKQSC